MPITDPFEDLKGTRKHIQSRLSGIDRDKDMNWSHFKYEEFACKHCGENNTNLEFIDIMDGLRSECGFAFIISSGYRCINHPIEREKNTPGPHQDGLAADIVVHGSQAFSIVKVAPMYPAIRGIGISQRGDIANRFIHLDICEVDPGRPRPWIWSY